LPAAVALLLLGEAGLAGAAIPLPLAHLGPVPLHFVWSLLFPMAASLVFGAGGGLVAALAGPVLIPFLLWPNQGWASLLFSLSCLAWFGWIGHCARRRALSPRRWNHPAVAPLPPLLATLALYLLAFPALLRLGPPIAPLTDSAVLGVALKAAVNFTFALLGARCLLKLAQLRRLLGLATPARYRFNGWVLASAAAMTLLLAALVPTLDTLLIEPARLDGVSSAETVFLVVMSTILLAGGLVCCRFIEEQTEVADRLRSVEWTLRRSEQRFELALKGSNDGLIDWAPKEKRLYVSPAWIAMLGYGEGELTIGPRGWMRLLHPEDRNAAIAALGKALRSSAARFETEYRLAHKAGGHRHVEARAIILRDEAGHPERVIGTHRDITEWVQAAHRQKQAQAVFNTTLEGLVVTDTEGAILAVNPAFSMITGHAEAAVRGKTLALLDSADDAPTAFAAIRTTLQDTDHWQGTVWIRRADGQAIPQWLTISAVRDDAGRPLNYVGVYTDISAIRDNAAQMEHLAHHDALTGLPNRLQLKSRLTHALETAKRGNGVGAVLFIDLDRFKHVNDSLGHRFGDELLQQLVLRLRHRLRESDTLARLGGDEFVAVLEGMATAEDAALVAASLIEQAALPFHLSDDHATQIGCSIGIALFPDDGADTDALLHNADLALYQAKEEGRGRYCFYNGEHAAQSLKRQTSNVALAEALSEGRLELYFQPVVSLIDGSVQGSEALLRWRHGSGQVLTPDQFMPMAENTALMTRLGDWVLKEACRIMKGWVDEGLPVGTITVNLSSHQFKMPDLPSRIGAALEETGLEPHRLELDITEAAVMPRGDDPLSRLRDLKSLGLRLALDDFGTGYSSFAKLGEYPVDKIKVDRKFVQEINGSGGGTAAAIVAMAKLLQIPVQAEGIETEWQREALLRSQCDAGQGYLFSHPMPEDEFRSWLDDRRVH
jgi:diguanylate cyclase (GGDEF)-like protein/PAS domain S-box-containing protein